VNRESKIRLIACWALVAAGWTGLAAAQAPKPAAEPLGRLFFTPAQRAQLDVARKQRARTALATETTEEASTAAPTPQTITYDGVVQRTDGKSTVWINSRPTHEKEAASGGVIVGRVRADGGVSLQIPQSGRAVELKPGQSVELLSGTIEEKYSRKPAVDEPKPAAKPGAEPKPPATSAAPASAASERDREDEQRKLEEAMRTLQESAAKSGAAPAPQPQPPPR
jgi:hypothetical protein